MEWNTDYWSFIVSISFRSENICFVRNEERLFLLIALMKIQSENQKVFLAKAHWMPSNMISVKFLWQRRSLRRKIISNINKCSTLKMNRCTAHTYAKKRMNSKRNSIQCKFNIWWGYGRFAAYHLFYWYPLSRNGTTNNIRISQSERCIPVFNIYFSMYFIRKMFDVGDSSLEHIHFMLIFNEPNHIFDGSLCGFCANVFAIRKRNNLQDSELGIFIQRTPYTTCE